MTVKVTGWQFNWSVIVYDDDGIVVDKHGPYIKRQTADEVKDELENQ